MNASGYIGKECFIAIWEIMARMILGPTEPSRGSVRVDGIDVAQVSGAELHRLRRQMQPVFQDPYAALNPRMTVMERGRLVETGGAVELRSNPKEQFTSQLIAATPELPAGVA